MRTLTDLTELHERDQRARAFTVGAVCKALAQGSTADTLAALERRLGPRSGYAAAFQKTAVAPMGTIPGELQPFGGAFLRLVASRSAFESLGLPKVPPFTRIALANGGDLAVTWVDEAAAIPVGRVPIDFATMTPRKLALLVVLTRELIESSSPEAIGTVERLLVQAIATATDTVAFDPTETGSLTDGAAEVTSSTGDVGDGIAAVLAEISGGVASRPALIIGAAAARLLYFSEDEAFRGVALAGPGSIGSIPAFTSPSRTLANLVIGIDRDGVVTADGGIDVAAGGHATLQMDDDPDNPATASTVPFSLWQHNLTSLRAIRHLAWIKRDDAVAFVRFATQSP